MSILDSIPQMVWIIARYLPMLFIAIAWFIVFSRTYNIAALVIAVIQVFFFATGIFTIFALHNSMHPGSMGWFQVLGIATTVLSWISAFALLIFACTCPPARKNEEYANYEA